VKIYSFLIPKRFDFISNNFDFISVVMREFKFNRVFSPAAVLLLDSVEKQPTSRQESHAALELLTAGADAAYLAYFTADKYVSDALPLEAAKKGFTVFATDGMVALLETADEIDVMGVLTRALFIAVAGTINMPYDAQFDIVMMPFYIDELRWFSMMRIHAIAAAKFPHSRPIVAGHSLGGYEAFCFACYYNLSLMSYNGPTAVFRWDIKIFDAGLRHNLSSADPRTLQFPDDPGPNDYDLKIWGNLGEKTTRMLEIANSAHVFWEVLCDRVGIRLGNSYSNGLLTIAVRQFDDVVSDSLLFGESKPRPSLLSRARTAFSKITGPLPDADENGPLPAVLGWMGETGAVRSVLATLGIIESVQLKVTARIVMAEGKKTLVFPYNMEMHSGLTPAGGSYKFTGPLPVEEFKNKALSYAKPFVGLSTVLSGAGHVRGNEGLKNQLGMGDFVSRAHPKTEAFVLAAKALMDPISMAPVNFAGALLKIIDDDYTGLRKMLFRALDAHMMSGLLGGLSLGETLLPYRSGADGKNVRPVVYCKSFWVAGRERVTSRDVEALRSYAGQYGSVPPLSLMIMKMFGGDNGISPGLVMQRIFSVADDPASQIEPITGEEKGLPGSPWSSESQGSLSSHGISEETRSPLDTPDRKRQRTL